MSRQTNTPNICSQSRHIPVTPQRPLMPPRERPRDASQVQDSWASNFLKPTTRSAAPSPVGSEYSYISPYSMTESEFKRRAEQHAVNRQEHQVPQRDGRTIVDQWRWDPQHSQYLSSHFPAENPMPVQEYGMDWEVSPAPSDSMSQVARQFGERTPTETSVSRASTATPTSHHAEAPPQMPQTLLFLDEEELQRDAEQYASMVINQDRLKRHQHRKHQYAINKYHTQYDEIRAALAKHEERLLAVQAQLDNALNAWRQDGPGGLFDELEEHLNDCKKAFTTNKFHALCAGLWYPHMLPTVRDAMNRCIAFVQRQHQLLFHLDRCRAVLNWRGVGQPPREPDPREGWPRSPLGCFGYEFDRANPGKHVCTPISLCNFIPPFQAKLGDGLEAEQEYLMANLNIRLNRLKQAQRAVLQNGDKNTHHLNREDHPSHKMFFEAYHCWASRALLYVHARANHPHNGMVAYDYSSEDSQQWKDFEMLFREKVGSFLRGDKKRAWDDACSARHRNPLTGEACWVYEDRMEAEYDDAHVSFSPAWLAEYIPEKKDRKRLAVRGDRFVTVKVPPTPPSAAKSVFSIFFEDLITRASAQPAPATPGSAELDELFNFPGREQTGSEEATPRPKTKTTATVPATPCPATSPQAAPVSAVPNTPATRQRCEPPRTAPQSTPRPADTDGDMDMDADDDKSEDGWATPTWVHGWAERERQLDQQRVAAGYAPALQRRQGPPGWSGQIDEEMGGEDTRSAWTDMADAMGQSN